MTTVLGFLRKAFAANPDADAAPGRAQRFVAPFGLPNEPVLRSTSGLRRLFACLPQRRPAELLDLGGTGGDCAQFFGAAGAKIHSVDLLGSFDEHKRSKGAAALGPAGAAVFVDDCLNFPRQRFDAILAWDALAFLDSDFLHLAAPRLGGTLRHGGRLLAFFRTQSRGEAVPVYRYAIESHDAVWLQPRETRTLPHTFSNRSLERLFDDFESVEFFLTADHLREVIVSR